MKHICISLFFLYFFNLDAQEEIRLLKDIQIPGSSNPCCFVAYGDTAFFVAENNEWGRELWYTDGDSAFLYWDIQQGTSSSDPKDLTIIGDTMYFSAFREDIGRELFLIDLKAKQLHIVDVFEGKPGSTPDQLIGYRENLVFVAQENTFGREMYQISNKGLERLSDINEGSKNSNPSHLYNYENEILYFQACSDEIGCELYALENGNINLLADVHIGTRSANPTHMIRVGEELLFVGSQPLIGEELFRYNPSEGATLVMDLAQGSSGSDLRNLSLIRSEALGDLLYLIGDMKDGNGSQIFFYNRFMDTLQVYRGSNPTMQIKNANHLSTIENQVLVFSGHSFQRQIEGEELFLIDPLGLRLPGNAGEPYVKTRFPNDSVAIGDITYEKLDNQIYFTAYSPNTGRELFRTPFDIEEDFVLLSDIAADALSSAPSNLTLLGKDLLFTAQSPNCGQEAYIFKERALVSIELNGNTLFPGDTLVLGTHKYPFDTSLQFSIQKNENQPYLNIRGIHLSADDFAISNVQEQNYPLGTAATVPFEVSFSARENDYQAFTQVRAFFEYARRGTFDFYIRATIQLSTPTKENLKTFTTYPNPAINRIFFKGLHFDEIIVYDQGGNVMVHQTFEIEPNHFDLPALSPGAYILLYRKNGKPLGISKLMKL